MKKGYNYKDVKEILYKEGYKLLSKEYKNCKIKLDISCSKDHVYKTTFTSFLQGCRCRKCYIENRNIGFSIKYIRECLKENGYMLISKEYKNTLTPIKIQCPEGHTYNILFNNFKNGQRCQICYFNERRNSYEYIKNKIEDIEGYTLLSKNYVNNRTKLKISCPKGHIFHANFDNFNRAGSRCPHCYFSSKSSNTEKELINIIKTLTDKSIIKNDRTQIVNPITGNNLELDVWIPSLRKAIEFNGTYWHSFEDTKERDQIKKNICKNIGIDLLIIEENKWAKDKENCVSKIRSFINEN